MWQSEPAAMRVGLARHDAILRNSIKSAGGIVFKTVGDAFCAAFTTAEDAVTAMVTAQTSLGAEAWPKGIDLRVRMAIHSGTAEIRDGDYFGGTLNRVARLLTIGHGGQCLLSQSAYGLLREGSLAYSLRSLGSHRLKDLDLPESVYQLEWSENHSSFPPLKSLDSLDSPNNLPIQHSSFVGRETELAQVLDLLDRSRVVSLVGTGGCGKSRLALQVAAERVGTLADGVWLVELAAIQDECLIPQQIADAVFQGVPCPNSTLENLIDMLRQKSMLLVLDNCEALVSTCADIASSLCAKCPNISVLCTSREPLAINGEVVYRVPSLPSPQEPEQETKRSLAQYAAVTLFVDRAMMHDSTFEVADSNAQALAEVCSKLDGIPLAIELAAARTRSFTIEEIGSRLNDCLTFLSSGKRDALPRQKTLRSLVDWSFDLLDEPEKLIFVRLSCFAGGWTMAAAEEVCSFGEDVPVLDTLSSLVDKSLVVAQPTPLGTRYHFLETIRQYAFEKLVDSEDYCVVRKKHVDYFTQLVSNGREKIEGVDGKTWKSRFDADLDNIRLAINTCLSQVDGGEAACNIVSNFGMYYYHSGRIGEGLSAVQKALEHSTATPNTPSRLMILNVGGWLAHTADQAQVARSLWTELLRLSDGVDLYMTAAAHNGLGLVMSQQFDDTTAAIAHFEKVLELANLIGHSPVTPLMNLGYSYRSIGAYDKSEEVLGRCLAECEKEEPGPSKVAVYFVLAQTKAHRGDHGAAKELLDEAIPLAREQQFMVRLFDALVLNSSVLITMNCCQEALINLSEAESCIKVEDLQDRAIEWKIHKIQAQIGLAQLEEAEEQLQALAMRGLESCDPELAFLTLEAAAELACRRSRHVLAATLQGAAKAVLDRRGRFFHESWRRRFDRLTKDLRASMGDDEYEEAVRHGAGLTLAEAANILLNPITA